MKVSPVALLPTDPPAKNSNSKDFQPMVIGLSSAFISFVLNLFKSGPSILGDELGYLSAANVLASEGSIFMGGGTTYHPGASLPFSFALRLFESPLSEFKGALAVNSLMLGISMGLIVKTLGQVATQSSRSILPAITLVSIPGVLFWSTFALSETAVLLTFSSLVRLGIRLDQLNWRLQNFLGFGCFAGLSWAVHHVLLC